MLQLGLQNANGNNRVDMANLETKFTCNHKAHGAKLSLNKTYSFPVDICKILKMFVVYLHFVYHSPISSALSCMLCSLFLRELKHNMIG